ncbi:sensor histidine kinase [Cohnella thailandensis]|uniref:histidine kinase n=1 Tax=Cohnella thailandensis TaxID=557557 RepID=A0A841SVM4_9BACL|nr:HAMP domain-containing sensor histidine kinase [Cohnella thailandensis]MBB6634238.1 HAMP domain-containing histidine kinase [Cohnella thailandensis]MBP1972264.1 two-component system sensor histidine kinase BaeS [Cohnella thailandensis]
MKFHWKLFLTMALTIVGISAVYVALTHLVVKRSIDVIIDESRGQEVAMLVSELKDYYSSHGQSWEGIGLVPLLKDIEQNDPSIAVKDSRDHQVIVRQGNAPLKLIARLGIEQEIVVQGDSVGQLYYYDPEIANFNKILIGVPISVVFVLVGSGIVLLAIALFIAYQLSKWLASPLRALLPSIERLGRGELGVQAHVNVNDEYGKIAGAFNRMSTQLEQAEKQRRNLTADIAHELRTPLTIIGGKLDELQQKGQSVAPEMLLPLQDELIRLNQLVEDLRTLSLAEAGKLTLNKSDTDMADLARRLCEALSPLTEEKDISLQLEVATDRTTLFVDPNRMKQVLINLLTNAIRYTPSKGSIFFRLKKDGDWLTIIVQDTGIGIPAEHLPHLFDRFYRADEARARNSGGTGLGLAIAKQFVLSHQGSIHVDSEVNHGTRFRIRLPYRQQ